MKYKLLAFSLLLVSIFTNAQNKDSEKKLEHATISFDYSFSLDSEILNWGIEYWSLMRVNDRWKITSVTWTMNYQEMSISSKHTNPAFGRQARINVAKANSMWPLKRKPYT
ncbi:MAG: hypothetical protein AAF551_11230 [Bacteroidota bacterium]